ncbi:MAG: diaminopimelate decarboxylase [Myxococcales bacterium]|nr:diaminopimelate decarboxylase [Myxococcales bacterium]
MLSRAPDGEAFLGGRSLASILDEVGAATPAYVYDLGAMATEARELVDSFGAHAQLVAFAVKANSAGAVVRTLARAGCGAEVGSLAELEVARISGIEADRMLLSGMGKSVAAIDAAIGAGARGILAIQVDSIDELERIAARSRALGRTARVALRVNPAIRADTHQAIATGHEDAKFGILRADLPRAYAAIRAQGEALTLVGLGAHVGSQLVRTDAYFDTADALLTLVHEFERGGARLELIDFGGGFGIDYGDGCFVRPRDFVAGVLARTIAAGLEGRTVVVEPGRSLVGAHGCLVASVVATKVVSGRRWAVLDAGMNDLLRPALYGARHRIEPLGPRVARRGGEPGAQLWRVVGPVCESSDEFGEYELDEPLPARVLIRDVGAYGFAMASNYNGRGLPTEIFLHECGKLSVSRAGDANAWIAQRLAT